MWPWKKTKKKKEKAVIKLKGLLLYPGLKPGNAPLGTSLLSHQDSAHTNNYMEGKIKVALESELQFSRTKKISCV